MMRVILRLICCGVFFFGIVGGCTTAGAQDELSDQEIEMRDSEDKYYKISTVPLPQNIFMEVTGMSTMPDGRLAVATRRGDVWMVRNPSGAKPHYERFANGLHEPLGLAYTKEGIYAAQRGELTRMRDDDGDGRADHYETVYAWPQSGNHHAFSYGPQPLPDGRLWVGFGLDSPSSGQTRYSSLVPWRGWSVTITPEGEMTPMAAGMKQPSGYGLNAEGDLFYAEHDGLWISSGWITHVEQGDFMGHPASLRWKDLPESPLKDIPYTHETLPSTGKPIFEFLDKIPGLKLPTVWFPTGIMGTATEDILVDTTGGRFGPYSDHLFVGDQGHDKIMRAFLEKVDGEYQGAAFPFLDGLASAGVMRQVWGRDGSMFVGMTSRGWTHSGPQTFGVQRIEWTGKVPFEMKAIRARTDGFELEFTRPVDPELARLPSSYEITSFTYKYHKEYGSPVIRQQPGPIRGVRVADDSMSVRLSVDNLRKYYIHEVKITGNVRSRSGMPLLHTAGYYTLNNIPAGEEMALEEAVTPADETVREESETTDRERTSEAPLAAAKNVTEMPEAWENGPDVSFTIGTRPGLRYDRTSIEVPAGARVALTFSNDDDMVHNLVVVAPETATSVGEQAMEMGLEGPEKEYIPATDDVLYYTTLLQPGASETIYFTAPSEPGEYQYVCTFPGHYMSMRGTMNVVPR
jgi:azurin/glucose/arabinose dehydrogenase